MYHAPGLRNLRQANVAGRFGVMVTDVLQRSAQEIILGQVAEGVGLRDLSVPPLRTCVGNEKMRWVGSTSSASGSRPNTLITPCQSKRTRSYYE